MLIPYYSLYRSLCEGNYVFLTAEQRLFFQSLGLSFQGNHLQDCYLYDASPCFGVLPFSVGPLNLSYHWMITSTLDFAPHAALHTLHWADVQLAARGQYNRRWCSALGRQIQLTLTLPIASWPTLFPIYALLHTLRPLLPGRALNFKWPNDLYLDGFKVAGMLTHQLHDRTLISVGMNTTFFQEQPIIKCLWTHKHPLTRLHLISQWIDRLYDMQPSPEEIAKFLTDLHLIAQHDRCSFSTQEGPMIFQSIMPCGRLLLSNPCGGLHQQESGSFLL